MPARKALTWTELRVGAFVLFAVVLVAVFVFYVTGEGALFARHMELKTYLPYVSGLESGAPVRLAGVEIGTVKRVRLSEFRDDPSRHAEITFSVNRSYQDDIRTDTRAYTTTEGLLGESVLELTRGVSGTPIPADGTGVVTGEVRPGIKEIVQNVGTITDDIRVVTADIRNAKGTLGKLIEDPALYNRARQSVEEFQSLTQRAAGGEGTLGKLMVSEELYDQLKDTANKIDQVATDLRGGQGTLGKLIYDSTIHDKAQSVVERADRITARVEAGEGTLGKLITEDKLHEDVKQTFANVREITRKINEGEGTLGRAANDPRAYENFNELTAEMRALISDFRKDPKRYLRIKLSLF